MTGNTAENTQSPGLVGSAIRLENDMYNFGNWLWNKAANTSGDPDPDFDFAARAKESDVFQLEPEAFDDVLNAQDFELTEMKVRQELRDRQTLAAGGIPGLIAAMGAGIASPTIALPFGAVKTGAGVARTAANAAKWGLVASTAQEAVLYGTQETRTPTESAINIGTETLLAGILGAGVGALSNRQLARSKEMLENVEQHYTPYAPAGADITATALNKYDREPDVGKPASAFGLEKSLSFLGPVTSVTQKASIPAARWMMRQMDTAGLRFEGNRDAIATAQGGDLESIIKGYEGAYAAAMRKSREIFKQRKNRQMTSGEFREEVGWALTRGGEHLDPDVKKAAAMWRNDLFMPVLRAAQSAGVKGFDQISDEEALSYLPRQLRKQFARNEREGLRQILEQNSNEKLVQEARKKLERTDREVANLEQEADDILLEADEAERVRAELKDEMARLPEQFTEEIRDLAEEIRALRAQAKVVEDKTDKKNLLERAARLEKENKDRLKPFRIRENFLRKRFRNLDNTRQRLAERQQTVFDRIETIEESQLNTLARMQKAGAKLIARLERLEGPEADKAIDRFTKQFEQAMGVFERGEARLAKLKGDKEVEQLVEDDLTPTERISKLEQLQEQRREKTEAILQKLEDSEASRAGKIEAVEEALEEGQQRALRVNERRTLQKQKLAEKADALDPEQVKGRAENLRQKAEGKKARFTESTGIGFEALPNRTRDPRTGELSRIDPRLVEFDFSEDAALNAEETVATLLKENQRSPGVTLLTERGPLLARTLDIDPDRAWSTDFGTFRYRDFLQNDIERVAHAYVRSTGPDIELTRRFGSVNPLQKVDGGIGKRIKEEYAELKKQAETPEERTKIAAEEKQVKQKLGDVIERLRYQRGVPEDPEGTPGGGTRLDNGVILPNTENWGTGSAGMEARQIYRAAIARAVDDTIITPGNELPRWADGNMWGRLLFQFRSFTFSSTQKATLAMLQDARAGRVWRPALGSMFSVALGTMGYYIWAAARGGDSWEEAKDMDWQKALDEGISRSGLQGIFAEVHNMSQQIPGVAEHVTFSGESVSKSPFTRPGERALGPTFDAFTNLQRIVVTAGNGDPTTETVDNAASLVPFQNHVLLRRFFEAAEESTKEFVE